MEQSKVKCKSFNPNWFNLKNDQGVSLRVRSWCEPRPGRTFKCVLCNIIIMFGQSGSSAVKKHALSQRHKDAEHRGKTISPQ